MSSPPIFADMDQPASWTAPPRARDSKQLSAPMWSPRWTRSRSRAPSSPAMTGADLVSVNSYLIQDVSLTMTPIRPDLEAGFWYFYYFLAERGRAGLTA